MINVSEALSTGTRCQQAGQLAEAEKLYRQVLAVEPENAHALHLLGTLAIQVGQFPTAIQLIGDAIRLNRNQPAFHANLAEAHRLAGDVASAIACNQHAIKLHPQSPAPHMNLGTIHLDQGDLAAATECFRQVVRISPDDVRARMALGRALKQQGKASEAEACFRRAVRLVPNSSMAHEYLGLTLQDQRKLGDARASLETAVSLDPNNASAHNNLGNVLKELHQSAAAESHYRDALRLDPNLVGAYNNLGACLLDQGRHHDAVECLTRATQLNPQLVQAYCNLARSLQELGKPDEAVAAARRAIELQPDYSVPHWDLGTSLKALGRLDEAIESYRTSIRIDPHTAGQRSNLIYTLNYHPGYDAATIFAEHLEWGRMHADALTAASPPHTNDRTPDRRLRIGYVSAHFCFHAVNFFTEPILASHDHAQFEIFCYANKSGGDATTERLRGHADQWRDIWAEPDDRAAEMIRADKIDVLVDLSGHIGGNRLLLFARKPAPVQVTYIGYQNTTGMQAMDYRLTDEWSDPPGETDEFYTESLVRLPRSFFCYQPSADAPPVSPLPALANGGVTFGSFNNFAKVTPEVLATWARLLLAVPGSRLVILANECSSVREYLTATFDGHGVGADRWTLADRRPRAGYLDLIGQMDIALDPFPFNGHTTTCDALWQGVPVVSLAGTMYASRFGSSALLSLGMQDLIAGSADEYVEIAARLAGDRDRLQALRAGLRERMAASPFLDFVGFTRNLEAAYRQMWTQWCAKA